MGTMSQRDRHRTFGILAILAVLVLVGWAVYESIDEDVTGSTDDDEVFTDEQQTAAVVEETQESNMRRTQETSHTSDLY